MSLLSVEDVEAIHWALLREFRRSRDPIDPPGVRSANLLASAVMRPVTSLGGTRKYPTLAMTASAFFHALVLDHPFHNGNKRTGLVSLIALLDKNDYMLNAKEDELYEYVIAVAAHQILSQDVTSDALKADREMLKIAQWIRNHTRRVQRRDYPIQFRQLRKILNSYQCECQVLEGNRIAIRRDGLQTHVFYGGDGREVPINTIQKIRADLQLDLQHGYDSEIFYNRDERISDFIMKYRGILERLAKD